MTRLLSPLLINLIVSIAVTAIVERQATAQTGAEEKPPAKRRYEDGPLTIRDALAEVPADDLGLDALTTTDLSYQYGYRTHTSGRRTTAWLDKITIDAVVFQEKTWNEQPENLRLLDHEQGHFDITYIHALKARLHFAKEPRLTSVAGSGAVAIQALEQKLQQQIQEFIDASLAEHMAYDRVTRHGLDPKLQREQREQQREQIATLSEQLKKALEEKGAPRSRPSTSINRSNFQFAP